MNELSATGLGRFVVIVFLLAQGLTQSFAQIPTWQSLQGPYGGKVYCVSKGVVADILCGTDGGVWRSINDGASWSSTSSFDLRVNALFVRGTYVYAGTNFGVYVSPDDGASWNPPGPGMDFYVYAFMADPSGKIFAGSYSDASLGYAAMYATIDSGATWTASGTGFPDITSVYAITQVTGGPMMAGTDAGAYRSADGGATWVAAGLANSAIYGFAMVGTELFAATGQAEVRTTDNGGHWAVAGLAGREVYSNVVAGGSLFAGTDSGVFKYSGNGVRWTAQGSMISPVNSLLVASSGTFIAGIFGLDGISRSTDNGASWTVSNTGLLAAITSITGDHNNGYIAATYGGIFHYSQTTNRWTKTNLTDYIDVYTVNNIDPLVIMAGSDNGALYSPDNGATWLDAGLSDRYVYSFELFNTVVVAGSDSGAWRSTDVGVSWEPSGMFPNAVHGFIIVASSTIACAATDNDVYRSTDEGLTWSTTGLAGVNGRCLATAGGFIFLGANNGLYRSANDGASWTPISLNNIFVRAIAAVPNAGVFVGTESGVMKLDVGGSNPLPAINGLTDLSVRTLLVDENLYLLVGTDAGGVSRSTTPVGGTSVRDGAPAVPATLTLKSAFPNPSTPFTAATTVTYELVHDGAVSMDVYNELGECVQHRAQAHVPAGQHSAMLDATELSAGIYRCVVRSGVQAVECPLVVVR